MNKKVLAGLLITSVVSSSLFAMSNQDGKSPYTCDKQNKKMHDMKNTHHGYSNSKGLISAVHQLNLTIEQQNEIKNILMKIDQNSESINNAFGYDKFDKKKFIDIAMNKKENMIKLRAEKIEKVYSVLSSKQKNQLKVLLELQEERKAQKGMNVDKYSNGRR